MSLRARMATLCTCSSRPIEPMIKLL